MADLERTLAPELKFPDMRVNLGVYTHCLASEEHQLRYWIRHEARPTFDSFIDVVHFFFDDTGLAEDATACIGEFLRDGTEAEAATRLVGALDAVLREVGHRKPDEAYVAAKTWPRVVACAQQLERLLARPRTSAADT